FCDSQAFSSFDSHVAVLGISGNPQYTTSPKMTAGRASKTNNHCHPASLPIGSTSNKPEIGLPMTPANGFAVMNKATARARAPDGNQCFMYRIMPGKKPASAAP